METIRKLSKGNLIRGLDNVNININDAHCSSCSIGKSTKAFCKEVDHRQTKNVLKLIHSDLCGPMPTKSIGGAKYFLTFTDDYSRKSTVYCLQTKDEVFEYIRK